MGRFGPQNIKKPAGKIISVRAHNENINKEKSVSFPLATKKAGNLRMKAKYKKTMLSGRKY
jgi:hypothetical protein